MTTLPAIQNYPAEFVEEPTRLPHVKPDLETWEIYRISEQRRAYIQAIIAFSYERIMEREGDQLENLLSKTVYSELQRVRQEPWKVDPPKEKSWWKAMSHKLARRSLDVVEDERADKAARHILRDIIDRYAEEIVGTFKLPTFRFARRFLTFFFNRLLNAATERSFRAFWVKVRHPLEDKLRVLGYIHTVRSLYKKGTVVMVPTHFSNLDSILIGFVLDQIAGVPTSTYGAGLNLYNTGYTAYFMNRVGAYRVDRRKKNGVYLETLKTVANLSIQRGVPNLFFPGGTRSRSGRLETKLKLGLMGEAVAAQRALYQAEADRKVFIVPMILSYPFVLEAPFLIENYLRSEGKERYISVSDGAQSIRSILKFVFGILSKGNEITISLGRPMDVLGNPVDGEGRSYSPTGKELDVREYFVNEDVVTSDLQREAEYTRMLGECIVDRYHRDNIVLSSHLVSHAAFKLVEHSQPHLDLYGVLRLPAEDFALNRPALLDVLSQLQQHLLRMETAGEIRLSAPVRGPVEEMLEHGIRRLGNFHVKKPLRSNRDDQLVSDDFSLLYYYHNRLDTYQLGRSIDWSAWPPQSILIPVD
ncbi:MAG: 1-acyl-sn-glycerol-3-phosphate acyltransferase [Saprospiraceae bacterium]